MPAQQSVALRDPGRELRRRSDRPNPERTWTAPDPGQELWGEGALLHLADGESTLPSEIPAGTNDVHAQSHAPQWHRELGLRIPRDDVVGGRVSTQTAPKPVGWPSRE
jgi:hypothetical protein